MNAPRFLAAVLEVDWSRALPRESDLVSPTVEMYHRVPTCGTRSYNAANLWVRFGSDRQDGLSWLTAQCPT
jgi:hypothetical protein